MKMIAGAFFSLFQTNHEHDLLQHRQTFLRNQNPRSSKTVLQLLRQQLIRFYLFLEVLLKVHLPGYGHLIQQIGEDLSEIQQLQLVLVFFFRTRYIRKTYAISFLSLAFDLPKFMTRPPPPPPPCCPIIM